jgi:tol-pal system protein YbgF
MYRTVSLACTVLTGALALLPGAARAQADTRPPGVIQLMNQVETLNADLNRLRGQLEVLNNGLENAQRRQRDMYLDLDTRMRRLEQGGGEGAPKAEGKPAAPELEARVKKLEQDAAAEAAHGPALADLEARLRKIEQQALATGAAPVAPAPAAPGTPPAATVSTPTPPSAPTVARPAAPAPAGATSSAETKRAYDAAMTLYRAGDFQGAIGAFEAFLRRYPRDALAANAQYWVGDAWFNLRDFRAAAAAQQAMIATYPDSPKVPDAMLNLSSAQTALGDNAAARKTLEELIARYPQSEAADRAKQRLTRLR